VGKVRHSRSRPTRYELEHDVWYFALDLDELDDVPRVTRLVRRNRRAVVAFRDADHLPVPASDVQAEIRRHLRAEGVATDGGRVTLITNLRILGYVFNPASFFLCRDADDALTAVVVEVHNTHGERHLYTLRPEKPGATFSAQMAKELYVSPFIGPDGSFPPIGRSIAYRCGAFHALAQAALRKRLPEGVSPAQVRGALTAVIRRSIDAPETFDANGWLRHQYRRRRSVSVRQKHALLRSSRGDSARDGNARQIPRRPVDDGPHHTESSGLDIPL